MRISDWSSDVCSSDLTVTNKDGLLVAVSRSGEIGVIDANGRARERYTIPYGATLLVRVGDELQAGTPLAKWDPHTHPLVTALPGFLKRHDSAEGLTVPTEIDPLTGIPPLVGPWHKARRCAA